MTELGEKKTERIHIHGILFTNKEKKIIEKIWKYGNVWIGEYVNEKTINYIVKYIHKIDEKHKYYKPIILTSPGIGSNYLNRKDSKLNKYKGTKTDETYKTRQGIKLGLPIYYRNKIYSDDEREKLWMNLLDKQIRYVNGVKIDISKGEEDYNRVLKQMRIKNRELGYLDDEINWDEKIYENARRNLKKLQISQKLYSIAKQKGDIAQKPNKINKNGKCTMDGRSRSTSSNLRDLKPDYSNFENMVDNRKSNRNSKSNK